MLDRSEFEDLVGYLARAGRLTRPEVERLVDEVLAYLDELPEEFVCRRHRAMQAEGLANGEIFRRIAAELPQRRFRAPAYTERQIRRMIYG